LLKDVSAAQPVLKTLNSRIEAVMNLIREGKNEDAARLFVETIAFGPGAWQQLPLQTQQTFTYNAPTWYDEISDEGSLQMDTSGLRHFNKPALLTNGTQSPPFFPLVLDELIKVLPQAKRMAFEGAGHVPHLSHPDIYIDTVKTFCLSNTISLANNRNI